jgi:hypothetical protein
MTWRRENSSPYHDLNCDLSVVQPVASHYTDCTILGPDFHHGKLIITILQENMDGTVYLALEQVFGLTLASVEYEENNFNDIFCKLTVA